MCQASHGLRMGLSQIVCMGGEDLTVILKPAFSGKGKGDCPCADVLGSQKLQMCSKSLAGDSFASAASSLNVKKGPGTPPCPSLSAGTGACARTQSSGGCGIVY